MKMSSRHRVNLYGFLRRCRDVVLNAVRMIESGGDIDAAITHMEVNGTSSFQSHETTGRCSSGCIG